MKTSEHIMREIRFADSRHIDQRVEDSKSALGIIGLVGIGFAAIIAIAGFVWAVQSALEWIFARVPV